VKDFSSSYLIIIQIKTTILFKKNKEEDMPSRNYESLENTITEERSLERDYDFGAH